MNDDLSWLQSAAIVLAFLIVWLQNFRQYRHNGGKSLRDSLSRIEKSQRRESQQLDRLEGKFEDHLDETEIIKKALRAKGIL